MQVDISGLDAKKSAEKVARFSELLFYGLFCHDVMQPQYTAYKNSPHSRVTCVECHLGKNADWAERSRFTGIKQLFAVATNSYPRPILPPIEALRPGRKTCERCHLPEKFQPVQGTLQAYEENVFPKMHVTWGTYRNNLGHENDSGCFRCHGALQETRTGRIISSDCNLCHAILEKGEEHSEITEQIKGVIKQKGEGNGNRKQQ